MSKNSELRDIREALNLSQGEMGTLLGVKQSAYQRWEVSPGSAAGREGLEKAKAIYRKKTGKEWASTASPAFVSREEFDDLAANLEDACEVIRFLLSSMPEGSRPGVLPRKFR